MADAKPAMRLFIEVTDDGLTTTEEVWPDDPAFEEALRKLGYVKGGKSAPLELGKCAACENDADPRFPRRHPVTGEMVFLCDGCPPGPADGPAYAARLDQKMRAKHEASATNGHRDANPGNEEPEP